MTYWYTTSTSSSATTTGGYYAVFDCNSTATTTSTGYCYYGNTTTWYYAPQAYVEYKPAPETEQQKADRLERERLAELQRVEQRRLADQRAKEQQAKRLTAEQVAQKLIEDVFGKEKLDEYQAKKSLTIASPSVADRRYVVAPSGMIKVYAGERLVDELCVHLVDKGQYSRQDSQWLPDADIVCGKAMRLIHDEEAFLAVAHHNPR